MAEINAPLQINPSDESQVTGFNFKTATTASISSISLEGFSIVKYSFSGSPNLRNFRKNNYITVSGCDDSENDGTFPIIDIDYDEFWIKIVNASGVEDLTGGGSIDLSFEGHALSVYEVDSSKTPSSEPTSIKKTVGTTAIKIAVGSAKISNRKKLIFQPVEESGTPKFYIGSSTVTATGSTQGIEIFAGSLYEFEDESDWYIISDTAAQSVVIIEQI